LRLSLVTLPFEDGVSFFQHAVPLGLILFGQRIPNLFQPGCQVQFHDLSLAYRGLKGDQVFTLLSAEAKGIARSPSRRVAIFVKTENVFHFSSVERYCPAEDGLSRFVLKVKQPMTSALHPSAACYSLPLTLFAIIHLNET
jgi:hypothetical protein